MYDIYIEFGFLKCSNIIVLFVFHFIPYLTEKTLFWLVIFCFIDSIYKNVLRKYTAWINNINFLKPARQTRRQE